MRPRWTRHVRVRVFFLWHCQESLEFQVGDEVIDQDGERGRIQSIDPEDAEKPYEVVYSTGEAYWTGVQALSKPSV
jgi:hypothetical protein